MNRSSDSEVSCTNTKKYSSTAQAGRNKSSPHDNIKERDYIGLTEVSSSSSESPDKHRDGNINLELHLSLLVYSALGKHEFRKPNPPDSILQPHRFARVMQNSRSLATREFQNTGSRSISALGSVKRSYYEAFECSGQQTGQDGGGSTGIATTVRQPRPLQYSASNFLKNRRVNPVNGWNKNKGLQFYWNKRGKPSMTYSAMSSVHDLCKDKTDVQLSSSQPHCKFEENCFPVADEPSSATNQAVGWSSLQSSRRNSLTYHPKPSGGNQDNSLYVKVNMDGVPIGRKVDLNAHKSYESLVQELENMFQQITEYHTGSQTPVEICYGITGSPKPSRLLDHTADVVLTYEDKEGDCMLVGDTPWKMFIMTVKRLRIMKTYINSIAQSRRRKTNAA